MKILSARLAAAVIAIAVAHTPSLAQTDSTVTYQGRLDYQGQPYDGDADYRFTLWDAASGGVQIGPPDEAPGVVVQGGLFTAELDFGAEALAAQRWLAIEVRTPAWDGQGNEPPYTMLAERQPLTRSPYSVQTRGIFVNEAGDRVGIGTDAPTHPLHVVGEPYTTALIESPNPAGTWLNILNTSAGGQYWRMISTGEGNGEGAGNLLIGRGLNAGATGTVMTMLADGRVGIGTTSPKASLHNAGDYYGRGHLWLHAYEGDGMDGNAYIQARDDSGTSSIGMHLRTQEAGTLHEAVAIVPNADVGIGTGNPQRKLDVVGDVRFGGSNAVIELGDSVDDVAVVPGAIEFGDGSFQMSACPVASRSSSVDFGSLPGGGRAAVTGSLPGALPGDVVVISIRGDTPYPFLLHGAYVPAPDQYRFLFTNLGGSSIDPPAFSYDVVAIRP